jgi:LmbE family N-acetylglucosaminyl deacetylase
MLTLRLDRPADAPLSVLAIGAHPDDVELGAGGTLLILAGRHPGLRVRYVLMTGTKERQEEARAAARAFTPGAHLEVGLHDLPEGRLPAVWGEVKEVLQAEATRSLSGTATWPAPTRTFR